MITSFTKGPPSRVGHTKKFSNESFSPYMTLVSKIFLIAIGCRWDAQEAPDLPLAVAPTGIDLAWSD